MKSIRCSMLPRLAGCPGSLAASENLASDDSPQSLAGTAGHAALEAYYQSYPDSTDCTDERPEIDAFLGGLDDMIAKRVRWYSETIDTLVEEHGGAMCYHVEVQMRSLLTMDIELTGKADLVIECNDGITLIIDYKFNWLDVPRAAQNIQLLGYVWLWWQKGISQGDVHAILTAGGNSVPFSAAVFKPDLIEHGVEDRLKEILTLACEPAAPRCPSDDECKYCRAHGTDRCAESLADVMAVPALLRPYEVMPGMQDCKRLFDAIKTVESFGNKFMPMLKEAVAANPDGWAEYFTLSPTGNMRTILDAQLCYNQLVEGAKLLTAEEFLALVKVPIGALEDAVKEPLKAEGIPVKEQKKHVAALLGENLELKEKAMSLKAVK